MVSADPTEIYRRWTWVFISLIGAGCIIGIAVPAGLGWDFANFYDAGRRIAAGQFADLYNPGSQIGGQAPQGSTGFFGTPLSAFFYVPIGVLPAKAALIVFKIQNVCALAGTFVILLRFYRPFAGGTRLEQSRFTALFVFLCLIYQPFWTVFRVGGQTTPTVLLALTVGLVAHTKDRLWSSSMCVVLAALIKPSLAPAVALIACISGWAFLWRMAVLWVVAGVLSVLILGWTVHTSFVDLMMRSSQWEYSWYYNSSLYIAIDILRQAAGAGMLHLVFLGVIYAMKAAVLLTILSMAWQARTEPWTAAARRHMSFLLMMVFYLAWSATVYEHYLSILFPFLIYVVASHTYFSRQALILIAMIFILSIGQNLILINWVRYGFQINSLPELLAAGLFKCAPLLLTMVLFWRHADELLHSHEAPAWTRFGVPAPELP